MTQGVSRQWNNATAAGGGGSRGGACKRRGDGRRRGRGARARAVRNGGQRYPGAGSGIVQRYCASRARTDLILPNNYDSVAARPSGHPTNLIGFARPPPVAHGRAGATTRARLVELARARALADELPAPPPPAGDTAAAARLPWPRGRARPPPHDPVGDAPRATTPPARAAATRRGPLAVVVPPSPPPCVGATPPCRRPCVSVPRPPARPPAPTSLGGGLRRPRRADRD